MKLDHKRKTKHICFNVFDLYTNFFPCSDHKFEDLSARARSRFSLSIKEAMSLKEIAKVWDECARATMLEYAERHGGGTFSSKYGRWESVLRSS